MSTADEIAGINATLEQWSDGYAKIWHCTASLAQLTVRIEKRGHEGNLHVVCTGCERICGSAYIDPSCLAVRVDSTEPDLVRWIVFARSGSLEITCGAVTLLPDVEPVFSIPKL